MVQYSKGIDNSFLNSEVVVFHNQGQSEPTWTGKHMHTYKYHLRYENSSRWTLNCLEIQNLSVALLCHQPVRGEPGVCSMRLRHSEKNALVPVSTISGGGAEKDHSPSVRQVLPLGLSWIETGGCYPSWQQLRTGLFVGSFERQVWKEEQG